ncbi:Uncharacterised protein [Salmonella enterica subsp. arizonae]|uniref:Uncharacterized protein n=1 Tax=Salmonella enterica subsp. arizonae TaxID=59203 RepID=A0A379SP74_SALER|nr:Uncharacterised protein [Salmonella enterica subsp. arizonae]
MLTIRDDDNYKLKHDHNGFLQELAVKQLVLILPHSVNFRW